MHDPSDGRTVWERGQPTQHVLARQHSDDASALDDRKVMLEPRREQVGRDVERGVGRQAGMVVGMLSDRDIRTVVGNPLRFVTAPYSMRALYVRDAMTAAPATIPADCELNELATRFADAKIGALPVVDRDARLVGIVSYVDVLRALATERHQPSIGVGKPVEPAVGTE